MRTHEGDDLAAASHLDRERALRRAELRALRAAPPEEPPAGAGSEALAQLRRREAAKPRVLGPQ